MLYNKNGITITKSEDDRFILFRLTRRRIMETKEKQNTIYTDDADWLMSLADELDEEGLYTKAIYLRRIVDDAIITLPMPTRRPNEAHNHLRRS